MRPTRAGRVQCSMEPMSPPRRPRMRAPSARPAISTALMAYVRRATPEPTRACPIRPHVFCAGRAPRTPRRGSQHVLPANLAHLRKRLVSAAHLVSARNASQARTAIRLARARVRDALIRRGIISLEAHPVRRAMPDITCTIRPALCANLARSRALPGINILVTCAPPWKASGTISRTRANRRACAA